MYFGPLGPFKLGLISLNDHGPTFTFSKLTFHLLFTRTLKLNNFNFEILVALEH